MEIKTYGLKPFKDSLKKEREKAPDEFKDALLEVATQLARAAEGRVTKRSGKLKSSIKPTATKTLARVSFGGPKTQDKWGNYAGPHHYGGHPKSWKGDPFVLQPYEKMKKDLFDQYAENVKKMLDNLEGA